MLLRLAYLAVTNTFAVLRLLPMSDRDKDVEILALRHQFTVLERQLGTEQVRFDASDRALLAALLHRLPRDVQHRVRLLVRPDTVLRWHRDLPARHHAAVPNARAGRAPCTPSRPWCCAWPGRIPAGATDDYTANCWCWGQGGRVHRLGDPEERGDRPGTRAGVQHLGRLPALPGRRPANG